MGGQTATAVLTVVGGIAARTEPARALREVGCEVVAVDRPGPGALGRADPRRRAGRGRSGAAEREIDLSIVAPESLVVPGDPDRMAKTIDNLTSNALKPTPPGGRFASACAGGRGDDRGGGHPGWGRDELDHLFDRFVRAAGRERSASGAAASGLAVTKAIADAHGGRISADSMKGRG